MVEEKPCPTLPSDLSAELDGLDRVTRGLRRDIEHERDMRHRLASTVRQLEFDREKSRADNAVTQLESERLLCSLRDELATARQENAVLSGQVANLVRDHKNLMEILERGGYLRRSKKPRTEHKDEDVPRKT